VCVAPVTGRALPAPTILALGRRLSLASALVDPRQVPGLFARLIDYFLADHSLMGITDMPLASQPSLLHQTWSGVS
jgi:hypothetical protein